MNKKSDYNKLCGNPLDQGCRLCSKSSQAVYSCLEKDTDAQVVQLAQIHICLCVSHLLMVINVSVQLVVNKKLDVLLLVSAIITETLKESELSMS